MAAIQHLLQIEAEPCQIYQAIASNSGLENWWSRQCYGQNQIGNSLQFQFHHPLFLKAIVKVKEDNKRVEWLCINGHPDWIGTSFSFRILQKENKSLVKFSHRYWQEENDFFAHCNFLWGNSLSVLKNYCELNVVAG